jgi:hypothetical protein
VHLADLIERNRAHNADLTILADQRVWPRDHQRSSRIARAAYLHSPDQRPLWVRTAAGERFEDLGTQRHQLAHLLA